jgi:galactose mutarotase-like enzyme
MGAELSGFFDKKEQYEYLWQGCEKIWSGQSPLLFPIVGKLKGDCYELAGKKYTLEKHGFARKSDFVLESHSDSEMTFLLKESEATLEKYPYAFELRVCYRMLENGFVMEHRVKNTNAEDMYFSIGAHPGFQIELGDRVVLDDEETASAYQLDENYLRAKQMLPVFDNTRELIVEASTFEKDALIFDGLKSGGATLIRANGKNVHVDFGGATCLGIWAKPAAPYVCIEPWFGVNDSFEKKDDISKKDAINKLPSEEIFTFVWTAEFID